MHLADFRTDREEIEVYCYDHIPEDLRDGILYKVNHPGDYDFPEYDKEYIGKMFVRALTQNAKDNWAGNDFNGECEPILFFALQGQALEDFMHEEERKAERWMKDMKKAYEEGRLLEFLGHKNEEDE